METVRWNDVKRKVWLKNEFNKAKAAVCKAANDVKNFVVNNPVESAAIAGAAMTIVSKGTKAYCTHAENVRRETDFYDTRTGTHAHAKRRLKTREQTEIDERFRNGESYISILNDMNLLK